MKIDEAKKKIQEGLHKYYESGKEKFSQVFNDTAFWEKLKTHVVKIGHDLLVQALCLYYCMVDDKVPAGVKATIIGGLGYLILPLDFIPDILPGVGFLDDIAVLSAIAVSIKEHITDEHKQAAKKKADELFSNSNDTQ